MLDCRQSRGAQPDQLVRLRSRPRGRGLNRLAAPAQCSDVSGLDYKRKYI